MRKKVLKISLATAALIVAIGFAVQEHSYAAQYERQLENGYTHAFHELTTAVAELDTALQKIQYANTIPMFHLLCTDIYGKSVAAQMALGELPNSDIFLEQTSAFFARIGDYSCALAHSAVASSALSNDAGQILSELAQATSLLSSALLNLQTDLTGGAITIDALIHIEETLAQELSDSDAAPGGTSFQAIESEFPEVPALIYDGPFSEHLSNKTPLGISGLPFVSRDAARAAAADFLNLRPEILTPVGQGEGVLPSWSFSAPVNGGELYIELTQQGCQVISLFSSRTAGDSVITEVEAIQLAKEFLSDNGYANMRESYHINQGGILAINFFPVQQNVLCYPDLVKVAVALDTGEVVGFESHGWIMNHTDRTFSAVEVDASTAAQSISPSLEILSHQRVLLPSEGEYEILCHEFKCKTVHDTYVIVYINAVTGYEEQILLLLESDNGTLVW